MTIRSPLVLVPARLASTRLPGKPLADIHGLPMIAHVIKRAQEADLGPVVVAAAEAEIVEAARAVGAEAILTDPNHPSGSDRIYEALTKFDPHGKYDAVINLQGDIPTLEPETARAAAACLQDGGVDIATPIALIHSATERNDPAVVKAIVELKPGARRGRALYFSRVTAPANEGPYYHHIGLYAYRREALETFVKLPPAELEKREKLEQLRALAAGMRIDAVLVDEVPLGVDTPAQLALARELLAPK